MFNYRDVEIDARRMRKSLGIDSNGIPDFFSFVNQQAIDLYRYPLGKNTILGFSAIYEGKKIIVSNSSEILSREIYTVAHELGHIKYDLKDNNFVRVDDGSKADDTIAEMRAYYFADCILMPEDKLRLIMNDLFRKNGTELRAINIVQMQIEFRVSFNALLQRLLFLNMITPDKQKELFDEREFYTSKRLFAMLGVDDELLHPAERFVIPPKYIDFAMSNYQNGYISLSSLKKALSLVNIDTSGMKEKEHTRELKESLDDVFEEYL